MKLPRLIDTLPLKNRNVFVRVDFNVPVSERKPDYTIKDPARIIATLPTIRYAIEQEAKVVLCSHFGRPSGFDPAYSLRPVGEYLATLLAQEVYFSDACVGTGIKKLLGELPPRSVLLLENIRFHKEEKTEDVHFYHQMAQYSEVYVNDAFGASHRNHASITGLPKLVKDKGMGFLVAKELEVLNRVLASPGKPFWLVLGGAKVSDKIPLIERLIGMVDGICIGGAMAYPFLVALGLPVGNSLCEQDRVSFAEHLLRTTRKAKIPLMLPEDHVVGKWDEQAKCYRDHQTLLSIPEGYAGIDIGPKTLNAFRSVLQHARMVFWNGPMGIYEDSRANRGTVQLAKHLASSKDSGGEVLVCGGDTAATVHDLKLEEQFYHVSTGGGASLTYIETGTLPGIAALL